MSRKTILMLLTAALLAAGCRSATPTTAPVDEPAEPTATTVPSDTPKPTETSVPPTATEAPPTETATAPPPTATATATAEALVIGSETAADGCTLVSLNPAAWSPLYTAYNPGSDPFFHIHTTDEGFFVNLELYTVFGAGWTGETGVFETDCTANGICVYLVPVPGSPYLASAGEIEITALSQTDDVLDFPIDLSLRDLTFDPVPGSSSTGCYHVEEVRILVEE